MGRDGGKANPWSESWREAAGKHQSTSFLFSDLPMVSQTTLVIGSTPGGTILPLQTIWGGKTDVSLPSHQALRRTEANENGFTYGNGDKLHWSSLATTKEVRFQENT